MDRYEFASDGTCEAEYNVYDLTDTYAEDESTKHWKLHEYRYEDEETMAKHTEKLDQLVEEEKLENYWTLDLIVLVVEK